MSNHPGEKTTRHIPALDGARGIAILMVLALHLFGDDQSPNLMLRIIHHLAICGWIGVDLFFVLSGFLITGILLDSSGSEHCLRNFYIRRALRIFPLYYGLIILGWIGAYWYWTADPLTNGPLGFKANQLWLWTYTINFRAAHLITNIIPGFNAGRLIYIHFWSLAIEEQFYLVWPVIILITPKRFLDKLCIILLAGGLLGRTLYYFATHNVNVLYLSTPFRLDGLIAGSLASLAFRSPSALEFIRNRINSMIGFGVAGVSSVIIYLEVRKNGTTIDGVTATVGYSILAIGFSLLVLSMAIASPGHRLRRIMECRDLRLFGKYSYGIYALHLPVISIISSRAILASTTLIHSPPLAELFAKLIIAACTIVIAFISYHVYEMQFLRLKRFFPAGVKPVQSVLLRYNSAAI